MRKIRTHLIRYIVLLLNDSLKDKSYKFHKINKLVLENLKIEYNLKLKFIEMINIIKKEYLDEFLDTIIFSINYIIIIFIFSSSFLFKKFFRNCFIIILNWFIQYEFLFFFFYFFTGVVIVVGFVFLLSISLVFSDWIFSCWFWESSCLK